MVEAWTAVKFGFYSCMSGMPWGGSEELWYRAARQLIAEGHKVTIHFRWWPERAKQLEELIHAGATVWFREEPLQSRWHERIARQILPRWVRAIDISVENWLETEKPDAVMVTVGYHPDRIVPAQACIERNVPYGINVQCASSTTFINESHLDEFRRAYVNAAQVYFVSPENALKVESNLAMSLTNSVQIDNPFNVDRDIEPKWPDEGDVFRLACVGRIHFQSKGQDLLVHVLRREKWRDRNLQIWLYGKNQGNRRQLRDMIRQFDLHEQLKFGGFVDDIAGMWERYHGLILPSRYEGAPLVVVEAMLCHRMCIATDIGRNRELIGDNETGFIASAATADLLDEALERAWQRRHEWQAMGLQAGARIRANYSPDPVADFAGRIRELPRMRSAVAATNVVPGAQLAHP
jgi:glycosyltransferase involved in cell wall biosynthesis